MLDNFKPALEMLASNDQSPESIQQWTFTQVLYLQPRRHPFSSCRVLVSSCIYEQNTSTRDDFKTVIAHTFG